MPTRKSPRDTWPDPRAPTKLIGEVHLRCQDLEEYLRDSVQDLSAAGVKATFSDETGHFTLRSENRTTQAIAEAAYLLGHSLIEYRATQQDLDALLKKHSGTFRSGTVRSQARRLRDEAFLAAYAKKMNGDSFSMAELAKELKVGASTAYSIVKELNEFLKNSAQRLRKQRPSLSWQNIVTDVLEQNRNRPGVTRKTTERALRSLK
jgi:predicted DNA-binding protein YlxM (UPF0122 family)